MAVGVHSRCLTFMHMKDEGSTVGLRQWVLLAAEVFLRE